MTTRRDFLQTAGLYAVGFMGLKALLDHPLAAGMTGGHNGYGYGPLRPDKAGTINLPEGFRYTLFSSTGDTMDDGLLVPGGHDGMAAFSGPDGRVLLVRNHELESAWTERSPYGPGDERMARIDHTKVYDLGGGRLPCIGGTTTLVFDPQTQRLEKHYLSLAGTQRNCAGGPTPWGTWITCEEVNAEPEPDAEKPHGYNFEVPPSTEVGLCAPVPLKAMGRFRHEAIAVDPKSGVVYQTEDLGDGLLYRFIPNVPGKLAEGGRLQALALLGAAGADTRNWPGMGAVPTFPVGEPQAVRWIDLEDIDNPKGDLRHRGHADGAAVFARGEGAWWAGEAACFAMTNGGRNTFGQIFRYRPSPFEGTPRESEAPGTIELFAEPNDRELLRNADNITVAPWGDLILCEDCKDTCRLIGVTPEGGFYVLAENTVVGRELAGACFSPDGSTLFVNVQNPGYTLAITGPWERRQG